MDFVAAFQKLLRESPQIAVESRNVENCPYGDDIFNSRNSYLCFVTGSAVDSFYLDSCMKIKSSADCSFARYSELCYECLNVAHCYNCDFCTDCFQCHDLRYCQDCLGCHDCFGSVGLRHKAYYIYNQPYSKAAYQAEIKRITFDARQFDVLEKQHPRLYSHQHQSENCIGDYITGCKNCWRCFDVNNQQDCMYYCDGNYNSPDKDCVDMDYGSGNELCYECCKIGYAYNCNFCVRISRCSDCEFCFSLYDCQNCFGCVYLRNKQYYILNQPYSKEEYFKTVAALKDQLRAEKRYDFGLLLPDK